MKYISMLAIAGMTFWLAACGSGPPPAPAGFDRRPANTPDTLRSLSDSGPAEPERLPTAVGITPPPAGNAAQAVQRYESRPVIVVLSDFAPPGGITGMSPADREALITAARSAGSISLYCRGDQVRRSRANWTGLVHRGVVVKRFLVGEGVDPRRIRLFVRSSGAFVADNSTSAGRAQNRRVEIHIA